MSGKRWVSLRLAVVLVLIIVPVFASADTCIYTILDEAQFTYSDSLGNTWTSTYYYFGWICYTDGGSAYEVPDGPPPQTQPEPQPPTQSCSFTGCINECDAQYLVNITDVDGSSPWGGLTVYRCGFLCQQSAKIARDTCYADCTIKCNQN